MVKKVDFWEAAARNPGNVGFDAMVNQLTKLGAERKPSAGGSHNMKFEYKGKYFNIQPDKHDGKICKKYQVRQILEGLEDVEK